MRINITGNENHHHWQWESSTLAMKININTGNENPSIISCTSMNEKKTTLMRLCVSIRNTKTNGSTNKCMCAHMRFDLFFFSFFRFMQNGGGSHLLCVQRVSDVTILAQLLLVLCGLWNLLLLPSNLRRREKKQKKKTKTKTNGNTNNVRACAFCWYFLLFLNTNFCNEWGYGPLVLRALRNLRHHWFFVFCFVASCMASKILSGWPTNTRQRNQQCTQHAPNRLWFKWPPSLLRTHPFANLWNQRFQTMPTNMELVTAKRKVHVRTYADFFVWMAWGFYFTCCFRCFFPACKQKLISILRLWVTTKAPQTRPNAINYAPSICDSNGNPHCSTYLNWSTHPNCLKLNAIVHFADLSTKKNKQCRPTWVWLRPKYMCVHMRIFCLDGLEASNFPAVSGLLPASKQKLISVLLLWETKPHQHTPMQSTMHPTVCDSNNIPQCSTYLNLKHSPKIVCNPMHLFTLQIFHTIVPNNADQPTWGRFWPQRKMHVRTYAEFLSGMAWGFYFACCCRSSPICKRKLMAVLLLWVTTSRTNTKQCNRQCTQPFQIQMPMLTAPHTWNYAPKLSETQWNCSLCKFIKPKISNNADQHGFGYGQKRKHVRTYWVFCLETLGLLIYLLFPTFSGLQALL